MDKTRTQPPLDSYGPRLPFLISMKALVALIRCLVSCAKTRLLSPVPRSSGWRPVTYGFEVQPSSGLVCNSNVSPIAVGTILDAVGTALPESVVTLVAVTFGGGPHSGDIGVGAALGGPLVVGTIAYATVGATLIVRNRQARSRQGAPTRVSDARDPDGGSAGAPVDRPGLSWASTPAALPATRPGF